MFDASGSLAGQPPSAYPLKVEGLSLRADGRILLDGIDLAITTNARTCLMGFNGAGKSLLMRCLHGMIAPTRGRILWDGRAMDDSCRREQAMVFQKPVLLQRTVRQNIDFAISIRGRIDANRRDGLLQELGLGHLAETQAHALSGGEQQRVALARALALQPRVLFLDEATANLDPISVGLFETTIRRVQSEGTKIIFVSHDIKQAKRLAEEVVFLHNGMVTECSAADQFFQNPASDSAQAYLDGEPVT